MTEILGGTVANKQALPHLRNVEPQHERVFSSHPKIPKSDTVTIKSNLAIRAWSIKCRRKKLITQFGWKSRDERFESN